MIVLVSADSQATSRFTAVVRTGITDAYSGEKLKSVKQRHGTVTMPSRFLEDNCTCHSRVASGVAHRRKRIAVYPAVSIRGGIGRETACLGSSSHCESDDLQSALQLQWRLLGACPNTEGRRWAATRIVQRLGRVIHVYSSAAMDNTVSGVFCIGWPCDWILQRIKHLYLCTTSEWNSNHEDRVQTSDFIFRTSEVITARIATRD